MKEKRRLLSMTEEDLKLLLSLRTEEKFYIDTFRNALKSAVILKWAETYEPDLYYQLVRKYKEFLNSQQSNKPFLNNNLSSHSQHYNLLNKIKVKGLR